MKKILLAGATGHLGKYIYRELKQQNYQVRVMARNQKKAQSLFIDSGEVVQADATIPETLRGCCEGVDVVISALGKSISFRNWSSGSFQEIDYQANLLLLEEAKKAGISQFIYISAFSAKAHPSLAYFKAHADFAEALRNSGLSYVILEPTALFSAFEEVMTMARKGRIASLGAGDKKTNPIFEGDVAKVAVSMIGQPSQTIPLGGQRIYTRFELLQIACKAAHYRGKLLQVPFRFVEGILPLTRLLSRSLHDKLAFIIAVSKTDCIAPAVGELSLEEYFELEQQLA